MHWRVIRLEIYVFTMQRKIQGWNNVFESKALSFYLLMLCAFLFSACIGDNRLELKSTPQTISPTNTFELIPFESDEQEIQFKSSDGTWLTGQFDWVKNSTKTPLVFIIHHSGPVDRDSYQYMAAFLVPAGYSVFRFDKRGTGSSGGTYGCCEAEDALAAYKAVFQQRHRSLSKVFIIAQSIGTQILASRYDDFQKVYPPDGVILLSNLLEGNDIIPIKSKVHIIISDQEPNLEKIGVEAASAHRRVHQNGASVFIVKHTEHTLFDVSEGPIDWNDPGWPYRFSDLAKESILKWLEENND